MQPVLHINPMFSDSREDLGRSPKSTSQPTRPPMPSAAEAYVVTAAVTLPDAGNLFQPMSRVIAESSPEHMRKRVMPQHNFLGSAIPHRSVSFVCLQHAFSHPVLPCGVSSTQAAAQQCPCLQHIKPPTVVGAWHAWNSVLSCSHPCCI